MYKRLKKPTISFVGSSKAGKTSLISRVVEFMSKKGLRVTYIKHAFHPIELNYSKDGEKVFRSGATWSGVISDGGISILIGKTEVYEKGLEKLMSMVSENTDVFILEGFKKLKLPKVEVTNENRIISNPDELIAVVGNEKPEILKALDIPFFTKEEVDSLSEFLLKKIKEKSI